MSSDIVRDAYDIAGTIISGDEQVGSLDATVCGIAFRLKCSYAFALRVKEMQDESFDAGKTTVFMETVEPLAFALRGLLVNPDSQENIARAESALESIGL